MATLTAKHPTWIIREADWILMRHSEAGERAIKGQRMRYLAPSSMMVARSMNSPADLGWKMYDSYLSRAVYHDIVRPALDAMIGVMHSKPAKINVPKRMEPLLKRATFNGDSMDVLLQKINEAQLLTGRIGVMLDVAQDAQVDKLPYLVTYSTESIVNWDTSKVSENDGFRALQFVVLNETGMERTNGLEWQVVVKHRVLAMGDKTQDVFPGAPNGPVYCAAGVRIAESVIGDDFGVVHFGGNTLDAIPFVFIGPKDLVPEPDVPPLLPLARIALAIYRGEADYRQALYLQGQQTLVTVGAATNATDTLEVGASAEIALPIGGEAYYIGASADGLKAQADAILEDKRQAAHLGANLLETQGGAAESGDALLIRTAARTSSLTTVAKAGAAGLELLLKQAAVWVGANPDEVSVEANLEFGDRDTLAINLVQIMSAKMQGLPMADETVHWYMAQNGFTNKTFEEEKEAMQDDAPRILGGPGMPGGQLGPDGQPIEPGKPAMQPGRPLPPGAAKDNQGGTSKPGNGSRGTGGSRKPASTAPAASPSAPAKKPEKAAAKKG